jgi:exosortase
MRWKLPNLNRSLMQPGFAVLCGLLGALVWAYWATLSGLVRTWGRDPQYSHGYLVPLFAVAVLWLRRQDRPTMYFCYSWKSFPLLAAAALLRLIGAYYFFSWLDAGSLLLCLAGVAVLLGGGPALRWVWPAIAFLVFMIPLPYQVRTGLGGPLQRIATEASVYTLQTLGSPAIAEGNTININDLRIGVVEACDGLSMLIVFLAICTAVAGLIQRPWWERIVIVASAIPLAVLANVIRITVTSLLYEAAGKELGDAIFHDWSGWLMMPLALFLLWAERALLSCLLVKDEVPQPLAVT